jgi:hypothetical protein
MDGSLLDANLQDVVRLVQALDSPPVHDVQRLREGTLESAA